MNFFTVNRHEFERFVFFANRQRPGTKGWSVNWENGWAVVHVPNWTGKGRDRHESFFRMVMN